MKTPDQSIPQETPKAARKEQYDIIQLEHAIRDDFGLEIADLTRLSEDEHGDNSQVFFGTLSGEKVFFKVGDNPTFFEVEDASLRLFQEHDIPSARPIAWKKESDALHKAVIVEGAVSGKALERTPKEMITHDVITDAGRVLKRIHEIPMEGFGSLVVRDGKLRGKSDDFKSSITDTKRDLTPLPQIAGIKESDVELIERIRDEIASQTITQGVFLHNDYHSEHIFSDGKKITGVIDLAGAQSGDPRYDIAKAHYHMPPETHEWLDQGYGELAKDPMVSKYELLLAAHKVIYRHGKGFTHRLPEGIRLLRSNLERIRDAS